MDPTTFIPDSQERFKLYYLIPISYVYLFTLLDEQLYLWLSLIAVVGATTRHTSEEAIFGPRFEDQRELSKIAEIRRFGTVFFRDKPPHEYSAESAGEVIQEGEFRSRRWFLQVTVLYIFHVSLFFLYLYAIWTLFQNLQSLDFLGVMVFFALIGFTAYLVTSEMWPDASQLHYQNDFDTEFVEVIQEFAKSLYAEDISLDDATYEAADAGAVSLKLSVEYDFGKQVHRDINHVAFLFCSVVARSSYPIHHVDVSIETSDGGTVSFLIDPEWCRQLSKGEISSERYASNIQESAVSKPPDPEDGGKI